MSNVNATSVSIKTSAVVPLFIKFTCFTLFFFSNGIPLQRRFNHFIHQWLRVSFQRNSSVESLGEWNCQIRWLLKCYDLFIRVTWSPMVSPWHAVVRMLTTPLVLLCGESLALMDSTRFISSYIKVSSQSFWSVESSKLFPRMTRRWQMCENCTPKERRQRIIK